MRCSVVVYIDMSGGRNETQQRQQTAQFICNTKWEKLGKQKNENKKIRTEIAGMECVLELAGDNGEQFFVQIGRICRRFAFSVGRCVQQIIDGFFALQLNCFSENDLEELHIGGVHDGTIGK